MVATFGPVALIAYAYDRQSASARLTRGRDRRLAPAWHPDPFGQARLRYWDGACWTGYVAE
ncbi:MAG: DUF2510 domain-containing protein [Solirubrobacterales bacterium]